MNGFVVAVEDQVIVNVDVGVQGLVEREEPDRAGAEIPAIVIIHRTSANDGIAQNVDRPCHCCYRREAVTNMDTAAFSLLVSDIVIGDAVIGTTIQRNAVGEYGHFNTVEGKRVA